MNISLKRITEDDLEILMTWRMRPDISKHMMTDVKLNMDMQRKWFAKYQAEQTQIRWIVNVDGKQVGSIYLIDIDEKNKHAEIGVYIADLAYRSLKLLLTIHWNLFDWIFENTDLHRIYGLIMEGNEAMIRFNIANGHQVEGKMVDHIYKNGKYYDLNVVGLTKQRWQAFRETVSYDKCEVE